MEATRDADVLDLAHLRFERAVILRYQAAERRARAGETYSQKDLFAILACKDRALRHLEEGGLLVPRERRTLSNGTVLRRYDRRDVDAFLERYIAPREGAALIGVRDNTLAHWVREGRVPAGSGRAIDGAAVYRFDKQMLFAWRCARLTFGEALRAAG